jgi:hypothetical protein
MLLVYYYSCRLLVLHQALREARREFTCHDPDVPWYSRFIHNGVNLAGAWGYEAIMSAESVLSVLISRSELALIGTLPDMVFTFISFAAVFLIMAKFALYEHRAESISGSGDALLVKTIERLSEAAYSPEHHAARCARIIASSLAAWEMRKAKPEIGKYIRVAPTVAKSPVPEPAGETTTFTNGSADPIQDFNRFMNPDIFLDSDFWASFMNNLSSGSSEDFGLPR